MAPTIQLARRGIPMPRRAKIIAVSCVVAAVLLSGLAVDSWPVRVAAYGLGVVGACYIMPRVPTRERVLAEREQQRLY